MDRAAILEGLHDEQRRAVEAVRGPVCILAGAGSGKTTTITRRIANQVAGGAFEPGQILAVTFTDKAAGEMRSRLGSLGVTGVRARTFHSAALAQLHGLSSEVNAQILPSKGVALRQIANTLPKPYRFRPAADLATEIEWARNRRITPERYRDSLGDHEPPIPVDLMTSVFARYEKGKRDRNLIDFEDVLELAIRMFQDDEYVRERFAARYSAFTVDEYQDVNLLQQTLLDEWLGGRDDVCVVGDDYQSIYGFTGATPDYLLEMPKRFHNACVVSLETNHRSTPQVLEVANRLVPKLGGARKVLRAVKPDGPEAAIRSFATDQAENAFITDTIRRLCDEGVPYEEMAILYRVNFRSEDHEEMLADAGIPYQVRDGAFLTRQAARQILSGLRRTTTTDVAAAVLKLAERAGYVENPPDDVGDQELTRQKDLSRLVRLAEEFDDGARTTAEFVADVQARFGTEGEGRGVNLMTLHRAKGLEFDAVFLPRIEEGELPFKRARSEADTTEERRLFYVGITRARVHLLISCVVGGRRRPSPFFFEAKGQAPSVKAARRAAFAEVETITADVGLEVEMSGGYSGKITEITDEGAVVEADGGAMFVVHFGERVRHDGKTLPLIAPEDPAPAELLDALKAWRKKRATDDAVPAYVVFHDATLEQIARSQPRSLGDLATVDGVGPTKLERYGEEVLEIVGKASG